MANRSYLYSIAALPRSDDNRRKIVGLSEWNYDIPLVYKVLLSGNPQLSKSVFWQTDDDIALVGDFDVGLDRLKDFLPRIPDSKTKQSLGAAVTFLEIPKNHQKLFLLENCEIYGMGDSHPAQQNAELLKSIAQIDLVIEKFLEELSDSSSQSSLTNDKGRSNRQSNRRQELLDGLGLENWSNNLYFNFGGA